MDIQGYILDRWMAKMKAESPVLTIYDKDGLYYDILPLAAEKGIKVIDTTKGLHCCPVKVDKSFFETVET